MALAALIKLYNQKLNVKAKVSERGDGLVSIGLPSACPVALDPMVMPGNDVIDGMSIITADEFTVMVVAHHGSDPDVDAQALLMALEGDLHHPLYWLYLFRACAGDCDLHYPGLLERLAESLKPSHLAACFQDSLHLGKGKRSLLNHAAESVHAAVLGALYQPMAFLPADVGAQKSDRQLVCEALISVTSTWLKASKKRASDLEQAARDGVIQSLMAQSQAGVPGAKDAFQGIKDRGRAHGVNITEMKTPKTDGKAAGERVERMSIAAGSVARLHLHAGGPSENGNGADAAGRLPAATEATALLGGDHVDDGKKQDASGCCTIL